MKRFNLSLDPDSIIKITSAEWIGPKDIVLSNVCEPDEADSSSIIFCEQERLLEQVKASPAGLVVTSASLQARLGSRPLLIAENPYLTFMTMVSYWLELEAGQQDYSIHPTAIIDPTVRFEGEAAIGAHVVIAANTVIGDRVSIGANCIIGKDVFIGTESSLYPQVTIYDSCQIGKHCILHSGVVIGADGFGYQVMEGKQQKVPQVGNVIIHDEVEIGANSCIDRATLGSTVIGKGTKIDNLVQVGHNCVVGEHSILCAQVGLAGSTIVGDWVYLAGQVGAAGHISIGSQAMVGAQSGIASNLPGAAQYFGTPAIDANLMKRVVVSWKHLPEMYRAYQKTLKGDKSD